MTSSVKVTAHCGPDKYVRIELNGNENNILRDGETVEVLVYDAREVCVRELPASRLRPTYYVGHPDGTFTVADPQPLC